MNADKKNEQKDTIGNGRKNEFPKGKSKGRSRRSDVRDTDNRERSSRRVNGTGDLDVSCNDPAWYHLNDVANKAAGNLPYGYPLGSHRKSEFGSVSQVDNTPGLAVIWYTPIPGTSNDGNSALNVAAQGAYSWIRHANSGHTNYDPSDLMLYYLAIDQLQTLYAWMCKVYGNISKYSAVNRYFPEAWFKAVNIDFQDFQSNIPGFLAYLNMFAIKLATFAVPDEFPIFKRHALLASRMFIDSNMSTAKFQVYDFEPRHIFKYAGLNETNTNYTELVPVSMPNVGGNPLTFDKLVQFADGLINPLIANVDDFGTMSGDVRKAYLDRGLFMVNQIGSDYATDFTYDEMILQQIHNMDMWGDLATNKDNFTLAEDPLDWINIRASALTDVISYKPCALVAMPHVHYHATQAMRDNKCVLVDKDDPTPDDTFEVTRNVAFAHYWHALNPGLVMLKITECGTEIFEDIAFITAPGEGTTFQYTSYMQFDFAKTVTAAEAFALVHDALDKMCDAHAFRYAPEARTVIVTHDSSTNAASVWISKDNRSLQNWTMLDEEHFHVINNVAMMSLWNVPRLGKAY